MQEPVTRDGDWRVLELFVGGEEVGRIESRDPGVSSRSDRAALVDTLRALANTIERDHLDAPADEILEQEEPNISVARGRPNRES